MSKVQKHSPKAAGKTLDEFRAAHDKSYIVPKKIRDGLAALGDSWEYEVEFIRRCGLSVTDLAAYRDPEFTEFYLEVGGRNPKRIWCGTKKFAEQLRALL